MSTMPYRLATTPPVERPDPDAPRRSIDRDLSAGTLVVEAHEAAGIARLQHEWAGLVDRCLEPNVFLDPDFCLPLLNHAAPRRLVVLAVWGPGDALLAVCPLVSAGVPFGRLAASWTHELCALAAPILDRDHAAAALDAILAWMARCRPDYGAWLIPALVADGPTARLIASLAERTDRRVHCFADGRRAVLRASADEPAGLAAVSGRKAKELRRQRRRLSDRGVLAYASATSGEKLRTAAEDFLGLERQGWKGRRGTALLQRPGQAAFMRTMIDQLAARGRSRIDSLTLDGRPIAMGIVLSSAGRDYFWKTAYDESLAEASPGVQFVLELTQRQAVWPQPDLTDSCARPDHPMIDHLWRGRIDMADMLLAVEPGASSRFARLVRLERLRRRGRAQLKRLANLLRRAFGS